MNKIKPLEFAEIYYKDDVPYSKKFNDCYFSSIGAIDEKTHVFLEANDLKNRFEQLDNNQSFIIGEIGFGLAINFLLTWQLWSKHSSESNHLHFVSTELHPLKKSDLVNFFKKIPELVDLTKQLVSKYPVLTPGMHRLNFGNVSLTLLLGDASKELNKLVCDDDYLMQCQLKKYSFDCWYLDGFSPSKNRELWTEDLLKSIKFLSSQHTTLSSYSVAGIFRKSLISQGFKFSKEVGIGNKKYFLTAQLDLDKIEIHNQYSKITNTPWHYSSDKNCLTTKDTIAIIGGGLAGCIMAYKLAQRGYKVTIFDKQSQLASQGSGNSLGLVHFKLSSYQSPLNEFMLSAYLYALRFYDSLVDLTIIKGIADILNDEQLQKKYQFLNEISQAYPELIKFYSAKEISQIANVELEQSALFWPQAITISPVEICHKLTKHENITVKLNENIELEELEFDKVIIAAGVSSNDFMDCQYLSLESVGGMVSYFDSSFQSKELKISLSNTGYITPALIDGKHLVGGSYHLDDYMLAHAKHLKYAVNMSLDFDGLDYNNAKYKFGLRAKTYDYLPFVGALPKVKEFYYQYENLAKDKNKRIAIAGPYHKSIYILAGFGSHGLTTIPLAAEILLNQILNEPQPISNNVMKSISAGRPLIRNIIKGYI